MTRKNRKVSHYTSIDKHKIVGKTIKSSLNEKNLPITWYDWQKDFIPEFLWIYFMSEKFGFYDFFEQFDTFLDCLESHFDTSTNYLSGTLSDFDKIPENVRNDILSEEKINIENFFEEVVGSVLLLYPRSPATWLLSNEFRNNNNNAKENTIAQLKTGIMKLFHQKDHFCSYLRCMPIRRALIHEQINFGNDIQICEILPKYPNKCSLDERNIADSFIRGTSNMVLYPLAGDQFHINIKWSQHFWNHNMQISKCENLKQFKSTGSSAKQNDQNIESIIEICHGIGAKIIEYFEFLKDSYHYGIYDSSKDDVILGLFSRITRLIILLLTNHAIWSGDISRIFLRCLVDSSILLTYLITTNDDKLFDKFIRQGLGKQKLLFLKLQDTYYNLYGPSGEDLSMLENELGGFQIESIDIELGSFLEKDTRRIAKDIGWEDLYSLVFDPASSDIHGNWTSIRKNNLEFCGNPLHKLHMLPSYKEPAFYVETLLYGIEIYKRVQNACQQKSNFPILDSDLNELRTFYDKVLKIKENE